MGSCQRPYWITVNFASAINMIGARAIQAIQGIPTRPSAIALKQKAGLDNNAL